MLATVTLENNVLHFAIDGETVKTHKARIQGGSIGDMNTARRIAGWVQNSRDVTPLAQQTICEIFDDAARAEAQFHNGSKAGKAMSRIYADAAYSKAMDLLSV